MSKNISVQEGGVAKAMTADKLKTNLQGGGTCLWVPEDETRLTTKHITEDGTYKASDDGYYGYSQVTVNGIGRATGIDPTTGEPTVVYPDPETGELIFVQVPDHIAVTTPPTVTTYQDGATIDFSGIEVTAYDSEGSVMQTVPFAELAFEPTVASYDPDAPTGGIIPAQYADEGTVTLTTVASDDAMINAFIDYFGGDIWDGAGHIQELRTALAQYPNCLKVGYGNKYSGGVAIGANLMTILVFGNFETGDEINLDNVYTCDRFQLLYDCAGSGGQAVVTQFQSGTGSYKPFLGQYYTSGGNVMNLSNGNATETTIGSLQTITVSWPRPGDYEVLETTFDITVTQVQT